MTSDPSWYALDSVIEIVREAAEETLKDFGDPAMREASLPQVAELHKVIINRLQAATEAANTLAQRDPDDPVPVQDMAELLTANLHVAVAALLAFGYTPGRPKTPHVMIAPKGPLHG